MRRRLQEMRVRWHSFWLEHRLGISVMFILALLSLLFLAPSMLVSVDSGHAGVLYHLFWKGTETDVVYGEGLHVILPWDSMTIYDVRLQHVEPKFSIIASNGLSIGVSVSVRFRPKIELLGVIHKTVGPDYVPKIIVPEVQALVRDVFGHYSPDELYTTKRSVVQQILQSALDEVGEKYIELDDLLLKEIILPATIKGAIEAKLMEEQRSLEMQFRIDRETLEAKRKLIEANGLREYDRILAETLSDGVLQYKGIEATLELARSDNSKIVVIGGRDGLPMILDTHTDPKVPRTNLVDRAWKPGSSLSLETNRIPAPVEPAIK
jgi:regulator of protease activity HflC (stomatin/prohibitin superfamily)